MKKLLMIVTISGFIAGTDAMAFNTKCGDDKNKKSNKECSKKGDKKATANCCKKNTDTKETDNASGEEKSYYKKEAKKETAHPTNHSSK